MSQKHDKDGPGPLTPAALVRTEAAALEGLAARLEGPMAADFDASPNWAESRELQVGLPMGGASFITNRR